jgi:uncharacterized protein
MIVSFSVFNFRSFSSEETLSLVASNRWSNTHDDHSVPIPDSQEKCAERHFYAERTPRQIKPL